LSIRGQQLPVEPCVVPTAPRVPLVPRPTRVHRLDEDRNDD